MTENPAMDHSNLFHEALTKIHDIAKNGNRNTQAWLDVIEVADTAIETARRLDKRGRAKMAALVTDKRCP
jgi:hypothetical protein